jgi:hypothetical protein
MEMPKYTCHKQVWALKIKAVDGLVLTPEDKGFAPFTVEPDWMQRNNCEAGGYYVVYKDGYKSYSPAPAFEDGYTGERGPGMYEVNDPSYPQVKTGEYTICRQDDKGVWIQKADGEGASFSDAAFSAAIKEFYDKNF